jgi:hypothetical protein
MQYKAIYLEGRKQFYAGETIELTFIIIDSENEYISDYSSVTVRCELTDAGTDTKLDNGARGGITTSGKKVTVSIPSATTATYNEDTFDIELEIVIGSKTYHVYRDKLTVSEEIVDWS